MGMLEKLKIYAYKDTNLTQKIGEYTLQINPEKYAHKHATTLTKSRTTDTAGVTTKFNVHERSEERRVGKECRSLCDWSSDVCSSDLAPDQSGKVRAQARHHSDQKPDYRYCRRYHQIQCP